MIILENPPFEIEKPRDIVGILKEFITDQNVEHFFSVGCRSSKIVYADLGAVGTAEKVLIHVRDVFRLAILKDCRFLILAHNHPYPYAAAPSEKDISAAKRFIAAGKILYIPIADYIIFCENGDLFSFRNLRPEVWEEEKRI